MKKIAVMLVICSMMLLDCAYWRTIVGGTIGAGAGGAIGGVIGNKMGNTAAGAIIGAAIGGRITTNGYGETQPVSDNGTTAGRSLNRRVEVAIFANAKLKRAARENKQL